MGTDFPVIKLFGANWKGMKLPGLMGRKLSSRNGGSFPVERKKAS